MVTQEKQVLTEEEIKILKDIETKALTLKLELGDIEIVKIQLERRRKGLVKDVEEVENLEKEFLTSIQDKYGKISLNAETGEITKLD